MDLSISAVSPRPLDSVAAALAAASVSIDGSASFRLLAPAPADPVDDGAPLVVPPPRPLLSGPSLIQRIAEILDTIPQVAAPAAEQHGASPRTDSLDSKSQEGTLMSLRINQNIDALNSYRNLSVTQGQMSKSLEKLSSGFRINRAADDAAGLAISEGLRSQVGGLKVAVRNSQDGVSVVQTAEGALTETHSILQRMRDLAVQASNDGALSDTDKAKANKEFVALRSELDDISKTQFNGTTLLDGSYSKNFQVGANSGDTLSVAIADMSSTGLAVNASTVDTAANAGTALTAIDAAIGTVSDTRADLGAVQNRLEHKINNLNVAVENLSASESRIRDTDMASEMMNFTRSNILSQAGTAMLAQANQAPQGVLQLLRG